MTTRPGFYPDQSEVEGKQVFLNTSVTGTFLVRPGKDGFFAVEMTGTVTDLSNGATGQSQEEQAQLEFKQLGPTHMQTRYGVNYRKTAD